MKSFSFILSFLSILIFLQFSCEQQKAKSDLIIEVKSEIGFNVLTPSFRVLDLQSDNDEIEISGVPENWNEVYIKQIPINEHQFVYQRYYEDEMSIDQFENYWESHREVIKDQAFSKSPIKCYVNLIVGKTIDERLICIIDENNNFDFSDDTEFFPILLNEENPNEMLSGVKEIRFQQFVDNSIVESTAPLLITKHPMGILLYDFPYHLVGNLFENSFIVTSNEFQTASFIKPQLLIMDSEKRNIERAIELFGMDSINGKLYEFRGVDISNSTIELKELFELKNEKKVSKSIMGETAPPFIGKDLLSNKNISLDSYDNKFIYLEFWADWCSPCIKEIPNLKLAYGQLDLSKVDFLGIVTGDSAKLNKIIIEKSIDWKQVQMPETSRVEYNVEYYPTSYLINPNREIVAKNLRGQNLIDTLNFFVNSWTWEN